MSFEPPLLPKQEIAPTLYLLSARFSLSFLLQVFEKTD
jgi:hypothetical protein